MSEQRTPDLPGGWLPPRPAEPVRVPEPPSPSRRPTAAASRGGAARRPRPRCWPSSASSGARSSRRSSCCCPKLKVLTTSGSMLVSIAAYSLIWGWKFALGFVVLLFVHEMGHVIQLRREGIAASAPVFIPFLGAAVWAKSLGDNALAEARVGLAGPMLGTLGAAALHPARARHRRRLLEGAGLHRLLPEPLQPAAGRAARRRPRVGGDGAVDVVRRLPRGSSCWPSRSPTRSSCSSRCSPASRPGGAGAGCAAATSETRAYYRVQAARPRWLVAAVYLGLIALLVARHGRHVRRAHARRRVAAQRWASRSARSMSRCCSRALIDSRLSKRSLPRASAISTLARGVLEVDPRRHERQPALLHAPDQALDLAAVGEQLARALGLVVLAAGRAVGRDVDVVQPQLAARGSARSRP